MSADRIVYCLERVTDYREFERLCSALMAGVGYQCLDPLGGTGDEGRDAIVRSDEQGRKIVFAYTVRNDWEAKLKSDSARVHQMGHAPHIFVFVCNEPLSASEKDGAHAFLDEAYGWKLDLFDMERLRTQLVSPQRHLVAQHPGIFPPPFFPQVGGQSVVECRDTILIDHVATDHALATWLARRLTMAGYRTWCHGTAPLAGESADESVRKLIEVRANLFLPVLTTASLDDSVFLERCTIASAMDGFVLPCCTASCEDPRAPSRIRKVTPADFSKTWNTGLTQVLGRLNAVGIRPSLSADQGRQIALGDYLPVRVTTTTPEPVFANVFPLKLPNAMLIYDLREELTEEGKASLRKRWAFSEVEPKRLVAFTPPPPGSFQRVNADHTPGIAWRDFPERFGRPTDNIAKELARRSLEVVCAQKGLQFCPDRKVFYFPKPDSGEWNQAILHVDGRPTSVYLTGERTKRSGPRVTIFRYQLAPRFSPGHDPDGTWNVTVRIYVRVTTAENVLFEGKDIGRYRKRVTRSWWNQQWLQRLLGIVQALQTSEGVIQIGESGKVVEMQVKPLSWMCPVGLDVVALTALPNVGEELAESRARDEEDEEDDVETPPADTMTQSAT